MCTILSSVTTVLLSSLCRAWSCSHAVRVFEELCLCTSTLKRGTSVVSCVRFRERLHAKPKKAYICILFCSHFNLELKLCVIHRPSSYDNSILRCFTSISSKINPLRPNGNQQKFSSKNIKTQFRERVMGINLMITKENTVCRELVCGYWGLKG